MLKLLVTTVVKPLVERLGTVAAVGIVTGGELACQKFGACGLVTEQGAHEVVKWVLAAGFIGIDLLLNQMDRKAVASKAVQSLIARNGG